MEKMANKKRGNQMETLIKVVKVKNGFAHFIKQVNGVIYLEFVGDK